MPPSEPVDRLNQLLDRLERVVECLESIIVRGDRSLWLVHVVIVTLSVTWILFVLAGFLAPLFFVIRTLPGG